MSIFQQPDVSAPTKATRRTRQPLEGEAALIADEIKAIFRKQTRNDKRSQQTTVGPSEIGHACERRLAYKLLGVAPVNVTDDKWAAFVGTAIHKSLEKLFLAEDSERFTVDHYVELNDVLIPGGTFDRADSVLGLVLDDKCVGQSSMSKMWLDGPSKQYQVQLQTYAYGCETEGRPYEKIALIAWPRERGSLNDLYVWVAPYDRQVAIDAIERLHRIDEQARTLPLINIAPTSSFLCGWCPYFKKDETDLTEGCPGR